MSKLAKVLDMRKDADALIAQHFGFKDLTLPHSAFVDLTDEYWTEALGPPQWGLEDPNDDEPDFNYGADDIYGTSRWRTDDYTMFIVWENGNLECWLFDNSKEIEE